MIQAEKIYRTDDPVNLHKAEIECILRGKEQMRICIRMLFLAVDELTGQTIIDVIMDNKSPSDCMD